MTIPDLDTARAKARERFRDRLQNGEPVTGCECGSGDGSIGEGEGTKVVGVRFIDSGQVYYFDPDQWSLDQGDWVIVESSRGQEAGKVVLAPHDIRLNRLKGDLKPVLRKMTNSDTERMQFLRGESAAAVRVFSEKIRQSKLPMKAISAEFSFDGSQLVLHFSAPERVDFRQLAKDLAAVFHTRVDLRQVGARDEAKLLGGLGRCGRTLCCSSWLPVFPEISMAMVKTQDLPLNPNKVSGVCGRLLCCLSYENDQYRKMKSVMPRLAQQIDTPLGPGIVMSLQILKELVSVRLEMDGSVVVMPAADLGYGTRDSSKQPVTAEVIIPTVEVKEISVTPVVTSNENGAATEQVRKRRRRRRSGRNPGGQEGSG